MSALVFWSVAVLLVVVRGWPRWVRYRQRSQPERTRLTLRRYQSFAESARIRAAQIAHRGRAR